LRNSGLNTRSTADFDRACAARWRLSSEPEAGESLNPMLPVFISRDPAFDVMIRTT